MKSSNSNQKTMVTIMFGATLLLSSLALHNFFVNYIIPNAYASNHLPTVRFVPPHEPPFPTLTNDGRIQPSDLLVPITIKFRGADSQSHISQFRCQLSKDGQSPRDVMCLMSNVHYPTSTGGFERDGKFQTALDPGQYTFTVRAVDTPSQGPANVGLPVSIRFTILQPIPLLDTSITKATFGVTGFGTIEVVQPLNTQLLPGNTLPNHGRIPTTPYKSVTFYYKGYSPVGTITGFECQWDNSPTWYPCNKNLGLRYLSEAEDFRAGLAVSPPDHKFCVRAMGLVQLNGPTVTDQSPACWNWRTILWGYLGQFVEP